MTSKEFFISEYENIFRFHRVGANGLDVASELSQLADATLSRLWYELPEESRNSFTVVALGGYGRFEMAPHSDVDVMILFDDEKTKIANAETAQKFLHSLWNFGFDVGHSVRTIRDCLNLYQTDVDVWASVLESRYVCGNFDLMKKYTDAFLSNIEKKHDFKFITSVIAGIDERHKKYEHSVKLLEPNLKNSAGGIRDLHSLVWLYRSSSVQYFSPTPFHVNSSACVMLIRQLASENIVSVDEEQEYIAAFNGILRLRNELHYHSQSQQDVLEFSKQFEIARAIGYKQATEIESVELCMREYFLHARAIFRLNKRLANPFREKITPKMWGFKRDQELDEYFVVRNNQLVLKDSIKEFSSPSQIVKALYWSGIKSIEISPALHALIISQSASPEYFTSDQSAVAIEMKNILALPQNVSKTLQMMNDTDVLGKIIPEWGNLVAFFQHSVYHYYTSDAHTLIALEHAEQLNEIKSVLGEVYRSLQKKEILFWAILFHDIAKPFGIQGHEIAGVDIWKNVQFRFKIPDKYDDVAFLIRNHLIMEQIAFRRNTNDPATIEEFSQLFSRPEQLDLLFILTYADLSAVNKTVWTSWKEMLLQELYLRTRRRLEAQHTETIDEYTSPYSQIESEEFEQKISTLDTVASIFKHEEEHSKVIIITRDAKFLLSTLCGVLTANDVSIFDAQIYTREDGIVIDSFRVINAATKKSLSNDQELTIQNELYQVLSGKERLEKLFERHQRRWRRRAKTLMHPNVKIDVVFHDTKEHTIIDVYAPDMTGFLFKITQIISLSGLQIDFAKLATRGDGIVDSFYVKENDGSAFSSLEKREVLQKDILHTIEQLMYVQM